jgi:hypothetical protein
MASISGRHDLGKQLGKTDFLKKTFSILLGSLGK